MNPKYKIVYESVKEKIINGEYCVNEQIPDGESLAKMYNCSVLTVKKALDMLVIDGMIVRKRGLGTFVKKVVDNNSKMKKICMNDINFIKRDLIRSDVTSIVEKFDIIKCDKEIAKNLYINPGDFVYYIIRIRLFSGKPRVVEYTWMPLNLIRGLELKHVENSIYYYIQKELKLKIQSSHLNINSVRPNELEKRHLNLNDNDFLTQVIEIAFLDNSDIFQYSISRHMPKYFKFETTLIKELI